MLKRYDKKDLDRVVIFPIIQYEFALPVQTIKEISDISGVSGVPLAPRFINKIIQLRGKVVTVFDLALYLFSEDIALDEESRIIVIDSDDVNIGILVKRITAIESLMERDLPPIKGKNIIRLSDGKDGLITGAVNLSQYDKRTIYLLDPYKISVFLKNLEINPVISDGYHG